MSMAQIGNSLMEVGSALSGGATPPHPMPIPPAQKKPATLGDKALGDALCGKLRELAALPPTTRSLMQLEQTARLAREILVAAIDPYAFKGHGNMLGMGYNGNIVASGFAGAPGYDLPLPSSEFGTIAPSSHAENFGAAVVRELGAKSGESKDDGRMSALELVAAIALAREKGLHDVAAQLEKGLATVMAGGKLEVVWSKDEPSKTTEGKEVAE
jgi:hypothetical protein